MHVLISGASIAGPALALWLARYGHQVTVVERAPEVRRGGYKVDVRGVAVDVIRRMGMFEDLRAASTNIRLATFVNGAGKRLGTLGAEIFAGRSGDDDELMRGDLAELLVDRTRDQVEYVFGDSITQLEQDESGVRVHFSKSPPRRFSLVIGADGVHSHTRALVFGPEAQFARYLGAYVSIFTAPNHLNLDHHEMARMSVGSLANIYSAQHNTEARNLFVFTSPPYDGDPRDVDAQKQFVAARFAGEGWEVPHMLEHMRAADDFYLDSCSAIEMPSWSKGRVGLCGDAAWCATPMSGQGTSLALVGAYVLAGELAHAADPREAFASYERRMRPFVAINQKIAHDVFAMIPKTRWKAWLTDMVIRAIAHLPGKAFIGRKMAEDAFKAARAISLPDYPMPTGSGARLGGCEVTRVHPYQAGA